MSSFFFSTEIHQFLPDQEVPLERSPMFRNDLLHPVTELTRNKTDSIVDTARDGKIPKEKFTVIRGYILKHTVAYNHYKVSR